MIASASYGERLMYRLLCALACALPALWLSPAPAADVVLETGQAPGNHY